MVFLTRSHAIAGWCLVLTGLLLAVPVPSAVAQANSPHVLRTWEAPAKQSDGTETRWRYELTRDPATGATFQHTYDSDGVWLETVEVAPPAAPMPHEIEQALAILETDAAITENVARADARVEGGFILFGDQYPACAPPARCLQFDVMTPDRKTSLQYVAVDLHTRTIIARDFFPDL